MKSNVDRRKTLTELEGKDWGPPNFGSHLVTTIHRLRYKPLEEFTVEDLRITIGQNIALEWLLPMAIERLRDDPFVEGDYYRGDLLNAVLRIEPSFWSKHPDLRQTVSKIAQQTAACRQELDEVEVEALEQGLKIFNLSALLDHRAKGQKIYAVLFKTVKLLVAVVAVPCLFIASISLISIMTEGASKHATPIALIVLLGAIGLVYYLWQRQFVQDRANSNESPSRSLSSVYWPATRTALLQQGIVFVLSALTLDLGQTICEAVTAIAAYWLAFCIIVVRRPSSPTRGDMFLIRYGFLLMFFFAVAALPFVGRALGRW
jgi:hypothetical protein